MPNFAYVARDAAGKKLEGILDALTLRDAQVALGEKGLFPVQIKPQASRVKVFQGGKRVKPQLVAAFYSQLAGLLRSGVPMLRSLAVMRHQTSNARFNEVLAKIHSDVEDGKSLPDAMGVHPKVFGEMAVGMIRAGSEGGFLEDALERVADFTEKQEDIKSRTMGALAYPIFLGVVGVLVVVGLLIFVVPRFATLFDQLRARGELPTMTEILLAISQVMGRWWWLMAGALAVVYTVIKNYLATESGRLAFDGLSFRLPLAGGILQSLAVSRFCRVLGTLLRNGVPILKSLDISADATGNKKLGNAVRRAAENISSGERLAAPLSASGYFPQNVVEMIAVAEESNSLEKVLNDVADSLEKTTWRRLDLGVRLLEPILLLVLALIVLCVVIALLLPVIKMSNTI